MGLLQRVRNAVAPPKYLRVDLPYWNPGDMYVTLEEPSGAISVTLLTEEIRDDQLRRGPMRRGVSGFVYLRPDDARLMFQADTGEVTELPAGALEHIDPQYTKWLVHGIRIWVFMEWVEHARSYDLHFVQYRFPA